MKVLHAINGYYKQLHRHIEMRQIENLLINNDFCAIVNKPVEKVYTIAFFCEAMYPYAGGSTSILRLAKYLNEKHYRILFVVCSTQTEGEFRKNALLNLSDFKYRIINYSNYKGNKTTICVATAWQTVYYVKRVEGYKLYFVQDYEPYFYEYGEKYLLAKKTYELGFHMVSLGKWNVAKIKKETHHLGIIEAIDFPIEHAEYRYRDRNFEEYKYKKEISIAVYIKDDGKRIPIILQMLLKGVRDELLKKFGITVNVFWFGWPKHRQVVYGHNLGKLSKQELEELYYIADFGMVASMTNISLVSLEMIACGLPLIEFEEGSFSDFLTFDCAILSNYDYKELAQKIKSMLDNPERIRSMVNRSYQQISILSWEKTCEQFENIIKGISEIE